MNADAIVVGGGLAGLVAAAELIEAGRKIILLDQEPEQALGGQAFWSFGGLFFVNSPEQRRMRIRDSHDLALQDWLGAAGFDREEDLMPRKWAEAYVAFAAGEKRAWLHARGLRWFPIVGWAERGGYTATEHGNSVPRFHVTWGTGPRHHRAVREAPCARARSRGLVSAALPAIASTASPPRPASSTACTATSSSRATVERGMPARAPSSAILRSKRRPSVVTSGGIGGNLDLVRKSWPKRLGTPPKRMICGVPDHVDGRMLGITGGRRRQHHQPRPHVALHGGHPELGPDLVAARHPHPPGPVRPYGSTRAASGSPFRCSRASTRWARSRTLCRPATSIPGSCSARRSSSASSRCPAPSRTPTSPAAAGPRSSARAEAAVHRRRCAPSWRRAPTSSSSASWPTWSSA
jgi:hypothetical protein